MNNYEQQSKGGFIERVNEFVKDSPLERFFEGTGYIEELAQEVVELDELLPKTMKTSLHQQVIFCGKCLKIGNVKPTHNCYVHSTLTDWKDDSSSMKHDGRWDSQKKLVLRIARIITRVLPEGEGVALRFINQDVDGSSNLTFEGIEDILEPMSWKPDGDTDIGTHLRPKILQSLVYSKLEANCLKRPLLISVITDGMPSGEKGSDFVDAILECGSKLEAAGYPRESAYLCPTLPFYPIPFCIVSC